MFTRHRTSQLTTFGGLLLLAAVAACDDRNLPTVAPSVGRPTFQVATAPVVNSLADDGDGTSCTDAKCTLRDAIAFASAGAEITFGVTGTVTLAQGQLLLDKNLTITGPGAASLTVSGNSQSRVFRVAAGVTVSISDLTVTGGSQSGLNENGGGISNFGTLTLTHVIVSGNSTTQANGGGIYSQNGSVTIAQSTVSGNSAIGGGGIYYVAGSLNVFLTVSHSTVSGNAAISSGYAGGIYSSTQYNLVPDPPVPLGGTIITNSTISGNTAENWAGVYNSNGLTRIDHSTITSNQASGWGGGLIANTYYGVRTSVKGSIISGNTASGTASDVAGIEEAPGWRYQSLGYNLIGTAAGTVNFSQDFNQTGDQTAVADAKLGALASNGGSTKTHALQSGSPAINVGTCTDYTEATVTDDQRGVSRPQGSGCDIGAFELQGGTTTPTFAFNLSTLPAKTYGNGSFNVAGYASTNSTGAITFATGSGSVGCTVTSEGLVTITGAATGTSYCVIEATLAPDATYSGAGPTSQSFNIAKAALTVTANNVTITYGGTPSFSVNYSAFVGSDNAGSLGGTLVYTFEGISPTSYGPSTTAPTNAGTYSITPGGLSSSNYSLTYISGTFTINKADGSVTIDNIPTSATVGGSFTPTYDKLGDGTASTASSTPSVCTVSGGVVSFVAEGTCTLVASVTEGTNYGPATGTPQDFTIGTASAFSSACTYTINPKNGQYETTVNWANATPGVTLIQVFGSRTSEKRLAPTASGTWTTKVPGAVPEYQLFGGTGRRNSGTELIARTACTAP